MERGKAAAVRALRGAQDEVNRLFLPPAGDNTPAGAWNRARVDWDDEVALAVEERLFRPLVNDARSLHQSLGDLAAAIERL